jgi:diguanylate cyclase (GGDEF)-like protein
VAMLLLLVMVPWPLHMRSSVISFLYIVLLAPSVVLVARHGWHAEASLRTVALTLAVACGALLVRGVHAWHNPEQYGALMQVSLGQGLTFLVTFLAVLGAGFGFVLACFERLARRMELLATHDSLTGCVNRGNIGTLLEHALQRAQREHASVALVMIDIDHFKQINDRFGHRMGDVVLKRFADTVRLRLRHSDVFGRVGGDEFVLLLPATDTAGAVQLAEEVRLAVQDMALGAAEPLTVTMSGGVAATEGGQVGATDGVKGPDGNFGVERLYALADQALYRAKHLGRNRIETVAAEEEAEPAAPFARVAG